MAPGAVRVEPLDEQPEIAGELDDLGRHYAGPHGALLVARDGGDPVGIVAVRDHRDGTAELKRMYLRPVARGRGIANYLIAGALDASAAFGCHTLWLETLRGPMDRAIAVYRRNGFSEVPGPGRRLALDGAVMMERRLSAELAVGGGCGRR